MTGLKYHTPSEKFARFQPNPGAIRYTAIDTPTTAQGMRISNGSTSGKPASSTMYSGSGSIRLGLKRSNNSSVRAC
ncbi:hypothetical protein D3C81_696670 [compost metagenome]